MEYITLLIGFAVGVVIGIIFARARTIGTLRIDNSDGDGPYLFVELNKSIIDISMAKTVKLAVRVEDFIPQK